jgi:hypothetical protein
MESPGLVGRIAARLNGEVAAHALESYRRAGSQVYDLRDHLDRAWMDSVLGTNDPWAVPPATQIALLCGWNALVLQTLADNLVAADYATEPRTAGFLPPTTAEEALSFYGQVAEWLSRAQQALHNEHYELDVAVPARLPPWTRRPPNTDPAPAYVAGLLNAMQRLEVHSDATAWERQPAPERDRRRRALGKIRQVRAEAAAAADYARSLGPARDELTLGEVEGQAKLAIERLYLHGQLVAAPDLALAPLPRPSGSTKAGRAALLPLPDRPGFDMWCLTDPRIVDELRKDSAAGAVLAELWRRDPDPTRTLALKAEIDSALLRHHLGYGVGHFGRCPWVAIYVVKRPLRIGAANLRPVEEFTLDIGTERGGRFRRRVVVGPFHPVV